MASKNSILNKMVSSTTPVTPTPKIIPEEEENNGFSFSSASLDDDEDENNNEETTDTSFIKAFENSQLKIDEPDDEFHETEEEPPINNVNVEIPKIEPMKVDTEEVEEEPKMTSNPFSVSSQSKIKDENTNKINVIPNNSNNTAPNGDIEFKILSKIIKQTKPNFEGLEFLGEQELNRIWNNFIKENGLW